MFKVYREGNGTLTVQANGRIYGNARVVRAAPLSEPDGYLSLVDSTGDEICLVGDPSQLPYETRQMLNAELSQRYLTLAVQRLVALRVEGGNSYLDLDTNNGRLQVALPEADECVRQFGTRLLLIDAQGNRFEIVDTRVLDRASVRVLNRLIQSRGVVDERREHPAT